MKMKDAGIEHSGPYTVETPKKSYPHLSLDPDLFPELNTVDQEVTLIVKGHVCAIRKDEFGGSVEIEVEECGVEDKGKDGENKADDELGKLASSKLRY